MGNIINSKTEYQPQTVKIGNRFSATVKELLKEKLHDADQLKKQIYNEAISRLNDNDKEQKMVYIKCNKNTVLTQDLFHEMKINPIAGPYNYYSDNQCQQTNNISWYVNFSDKNLFGYYHTPLFAQDEVQCCQFPLLPYIKQYIQLHSKQEEGYYPVTRVGMNSFPILILNCQQLCMVDLIKQTTTYPYGIYGNSFKNLKSEDIKQFFTFPEKEQRKTKINLICMTALSVVDQKSSQKQYTSAEIVYTFETVYRAFYSAVQESKSSKKNVEVVINTGNWGSGAFGNNLEFTVLVQLAAAHLAKVDCLNYYTFDENGYQGFNFGYNLFKSFISKQKEQSVELSLQFQLQFLQFCLDQKFCWNQSNGS